MLTPQVGRATLRLKSKADAPENIRPVSIQKVTPQVHPSDHRVRRNSLGEIF